MARYTCSFTVAAPINRLRELLEEVLQTCNLEIIYDKSDFMMARELPGQVAFPKLVTVEALIDKTAVYEDSKTQIKLVIKNEELPLQVNNHCHQMFNMVNRAISENRHWQLVENVAR